MIQGILKDVSWERSSKEISWWFQINFKEICFMGITRNFEGCFKVVLSGFLGHLKESQRVCQMSFSGVSMVFQGYFKEVSRVF